MNRFNAVNKQQRKPICCKELESIRGIFNEKEKELSVALAKIDSLTRQLEELKNGNITNSYNINSATSSITSTNNFNSNCQINSPKYNVELEKLKKELLYRTKLNEKIDGEMILKRKMINQRTIELNNIDQKINVLQTRLNRKRTLNQQLYVQMQNHLIRSDSNLNTNNNQSNVFSDNNSNTENNVPNCNNSLIKANLRRSIGAGQPYKFTHLRPLNPLEPLQKAKTETDLKNCKNNNNFINLKQTNLNNNLINNNDNCMQNMNNLNLNHNDLLFKNNFSNQANSFTFKPSKNSTNQVQELYSSLEDVNQLYLNNQSNNQNLNLPNEFNLNTNHLLNTPLIDDFNLNNQPFNDSLSKENENKLNETFTSQDSRLNTINNTAKYLLLENSAQKEIKSNKLNLSSSSPVLSSTSSSTVSEFIPSSSSTSSLFEYNSKFQTVKPTCKLPMNTSYRLTNLNPAKRDQNGIEKGYVYKSVQQLQQNLNNAQNGNSSNSISNPVQQQQHQKQNYDIESSKQLDHEEINLKNNSLIRNKTNEQPENENLTNRDIYLNEHEKISDKEFMMNGKQEDNKLINNNNNNNNNNFNSDNNTKKNNFGFVLQSNSNHKQLDCNNKTTNKYLEDKVQAENNSDLSNETISNLSIYSEKKNILKLNLNNDWIRKRRPLVVDTDLEEQFDKINVNLNLNNNIFNENSFNLLSKNDHENNFNTSNQIENNNFCSRLNETGILHQNQNDEHDKHEDEEDVEEEQEEEEEEDVEEEQEEEEEEDVEEEEDCVLTSSSNVSPISSDELNEKNKLQFRNVIRNIMCKNLSNSSDKNITMSEEEETDEEDENSVDCKAVINELNLKSIKNLSKIDLPDGDLRTSKEKLANSKTSNLFNNDLDTEKQDKNIFDAYEDNILDKDNEINQNFNEENLVVHKNQLEKDAEKNEVLKRTKSNLKKQFGKNKRRVSFDPLALLLDAALEGELELVKKTASQVPNPSASSEGITALHNAICAGYFKIVKYLVEIGCDVNAQDNDGWTPLHCAASCNNLPMVKYLVEHGACIFAVTFCDHETPAQKCEEKADGYHGCSQYLYSMQEKLGVLNGGSVYAVYDYNAQQPDELNFKCGELLRVLNRSDESETEWWWASNNQQQQGYVPRNLLSIYPRISVKSKELKKEN